MEETIERSDEATQRRNQDSLPTLFRGVPCGRPASRGALEPHSLIIVACLHEQLRPNAATLAACDCIEIGQYCIEIEHFIGSRFAHKSATCYYLYN